MDHFLQKSCNTQSEFKTAKFQCDNDISKIGILLCTYVAAKVIAICSHETLKLNIGGVNSTSVLV